MKYVQPYGETDPNAPYINGDPSIGRMGSIPPAAAFEHPMRELVALIEASKLAPLDTDLKQIAKSVRSQRMNYAADTGSANTLTVAYDPPLTGYTVGLVLRVKALFTNTGASTIDAGGGRVAIKKPNGAATAAGDIPSGGLIELVYDGTAFQMINFGGAGGGGAGDTFLVNIPYAVDSSGVPNTVTANFSPAITSLVAGTIIMVKISNTNTGLTNINVNGLGLKPIYAQGGSSTNYPLLPGDLIVGDVVVLTYDGTRFWVSANTIINQDSSFSVNTVTQINELFVALGRKRILANASVTITMASGIYPPFYTYHNNADRITVQGTLLAAVPTFSSFAKTGNSAAARAADSANNIAMLRSRYGTEVRFDNTLSGAAIFHTGPGRIRFRNILVTGPNVAPPAGWTNCGFGAGSGVAMDCVNCSVWGSGSNGYVAGSGEINMYESFASGCGGSGILAHAGGTIITQACGAYGNGYSGIQAVVNAVIQLFSQPAVGAQPAIAGSEAIANGNFGIITDNFGMIQMFQAGTCTGNGMTDAIASRQSNISFTGASVFGTTSPAINTTGNFNSIVTQS